MASDPVPAAPRRGRPPKMAFDRRWELVLDAATVVFAERGLAGGSIGEVAARAGVNRAQVYAHVASKAELFEAAVLREREAVVAAIAARLDATAGLPGRERVRARYAVLVDEARAHPARMALLARPESASLLASVGRSSAPDHLEATLRAELADAGMPAQELPAILAAMIIGMVHQVIEQGRKAGWDSEAVIDLLADFTLAGLGGLAPEVAAAADRPGPSPS